MTKEQTNKALYIVGFLSFIALIVELLTLTKLYGIFFVAPMLGIISFIGCVVMVVLIAAPFLKQNLLLFFIIVDSLLGNSYLSNLHSLYDYFTGSVDLVTIGIVPGVLVSISSVALDTVGLLVLYLRILGYIKEHRAGLKTQF